MKNRILLTTIKGSLCNGWMTGEAYHNVRFDWYDGYGIRHSEDRNIHACYSVNEAIIYAVSIVMGMCPALRRQWETICERYPYED